MTKKIIIYILVWIFPITVLAQQEAMFTHYMYNTLAVNPAYAGSRNALSISTLHRSQWLSFPGAPQTQTITLHSPVYKDAVNLGFSMIHDKIGPINNTGIFIDYALRVKLTKKSKIAFGLKFACNSYSYDLQNLKVINPIDVEIAKSESHLIPNIGFGIYYSQEKFYVGLSTPKLFENNYIYSADYSTLSIEKKHFYFILGGITPLSKDIKFKPTTLLKIVQGSPIQADITTEFLFADKLSTGLMYRTIESLGVLVGIAATQKLNIGYSFDWSFANSTSKYNYGSHEIIIRYDLIPKRKHKYTSTKSFCKF